MKKLLTIMVLLASLLVSTSCIKRDDLENIVVYTTSHPVEYLVKRLYGYNSEVLSVYPDGVDPSKFTLTEKKLKDYAKHGQLLVYNGLSDEKLIAASFLNNNRNMKIIDVSQGLEVNYYTEELWLNPTNYLMMASNIRKGLKEYISNQYILEEIDERYDKLKEDISALESEITLIAENSKNKVILTGSNMLMFLEKYGYEVVSLDETVESVSKTTIANAKKLITDKTVSYIFMLDGAQATDTINSIIKDTTVKTAIIKPITNLTTEQRSNNETYITIMKNNIEAIRNEMYE